MKNVLKFGFLACSLALTVIACGGEHKTEETVVTDSVAVTTTDSSAMAAPMDTAAPAMADSAAAPAMEGKH